MKFINACLNCGFMDANESEYNCPICKSVFYKLSKNDGNKLIKCNQSQRIQWVEDKIGHPIPYELNELRENYKNKKWQEIEQQKEYEQSIKLSDALEHGKAILEGQTQTPKCPSCGSSNISKIGVVDRAVSFKLVGFASSKIDKTHKCNNCGTMW